MIMMQVVPESCLGNKALNDQKSNVHSFKRRKTGLGHGIFKKFFAIMAAIQVIRPRVGENKFPTQGPKESRNQLK